MLSGPALQEVACLQGFMVHCKHIICHLLAYYHVAYHDYYCMVGRGDYNSLPPDICWAKRTNVRSKLGVV